MGKIRITGEKKTNTGIRLLVSLILTAILFIVMVITYNRLTNNEKQISVAIAKKEISADTLITEKNVKEYFDIKKIRESYLPENYIQETDNIVGNITASSISANTIITENDLIKENSILKNMNDPVVVGIQVDEIYKSINGSLRAGDIVDMTIITGLDLIVIENVYICDARNSSGVSVDKSDVKTVATNFDIYIERDLQGWYNQEISNGSIYFSKKDNPEYDNIFNVKILED